MDRWDELFRQPNFCAAPSLPISNISGKIILITGAGGCIGSALTKTIAASDLHLLILLDHSEENLYRIHIDLEGRFPRTPHVAILGDAGDRKLLSEIFDNYHPQIVFHAAAYKHVPLMEANPFAVVGNNALATMVLAETCVQYQAGRLVMISTDKAVYPRSVMGASKRIAELVLLSFGNAKTKMAAVRFGNVFGSNGSVVPLFFQQIASGGPVTVTHPGAYRYFHALGEAIELILAASSGERHGIFIPQMREPIRILDLANRLIGTAGTRSAKNIEVIFTGLRPGEKLTEDMVSAEETIEPISDPLLHRVKAPDISRNLLQAALNGISESLRERNLALLLDNISSLVPEYRPSEALLGFLKHLLA